MEVQGQEYSVCALGNHRGVLRQIVSKVLKCGPGFGKTEQGRHTGGKSSRGKSIELGCEVCVCVCVCVCVNEHDRKRQFPVTAETMQVDILWQKALRAYKRRLYSAKQAKKTALKITEGEKAMKNVLA